MNGRPVVATTLLYTVTAATLVFIAAPLLVTMSLSVSDTQFVSFPPTGFTLAWYGKVLADPDFQSAKISNVFSLRNGTINMISRQRFKGIELFYNPFGSFCKL